MLTCTTVMVVSPARNLPLNSASRYTGCERTRESVPCERSELMASNPRVMPISGPKKLRKNRKGGMAPLLPVNSCRKTRSGGTSPASSGSERTATKPAHVDANRISPSRMTKRRLPKWSDSSFQKYRDHEADASAAASACLKKYI